jgi:hypothetical protein
MKSRSIAVRTGVAAALMMVPLTVASQVSGASPTTLYVGPGGTNTNNNCQTSLNPCLTISFALTQAASGATIKVQRGTYNEQVKITKPVTIIGAGASQTVIEPTSVSASDSDTDSTIPQLYIVDVTHTTGVNLKGIGVNGSEASTSFTGCSQNYVGVYYHDASGSMANDTVTGIELPPADFSCQDGLGVYATTDSGSLTPTVLSMRSDNVNNYDKNGITCDDPGTVCDIKNTTVTGIGSTNLIAQNGIQIWAASGGVTANVITGNSYEGSPPNNAAGILIGDPYTLSVKNNQVTHNDTDIWLLEDQSPAEVYCGNLTSSCTNPPAPGTTFRFTGNHASDAINYENNPVGSEFGDGIDIDSVAQPMTVIHNVVENDPGNGIALLGTTGVVAQRNTVRSDDNGFYLGAGTVGVSANANTLRKNTVSSSSNVGILLDTQTGGNTVVHNSSQLNSVLDAQDNSSGAGTAGTGNNWEADDCTTSAPSGLCHTAASVRSSVRSAAAARAPRAASRERPALRRVGPAFFR